MSITIKQISAFVAVARSKSFVEACERIHLSQPALSITIKNLEDTLGGTLFTRSTRTLGLTPEGEAFLPVARRLLNDCELAVTDISNLFSLKRGKLSIAAMPFFAGSYLPNILLKYQSLYPDINISIHDVVNEGVIESTRAGRVELGVCFDPGEHEDIQFDALFTEQYIALLPTNHILAKKKAIRWDNLLEYPFLTLQQPSSLHRDIKKTMQENDINFSVYIETHQITTIGRMVSLGLGVSAVPESCKEQMIEMGAVCRPLTCPVISKKVGLIYRRRYALSAAATEMKRQMIDYFNPGVN